MSVFLLEIYYHRTEATPLRIAQTSVHISVYQILNNEYDIELVKLCSRSRLLQQKVILVEM